MNREPDPEHSAPHRVEAYLDAMLTSLPRRLSAFQISELRRELRTHLWERVAAYEELGQTEDDAVTEALQQFGGGKDFVKQWRREWKKPTRRLTVREVWEATVPALGLSAVMLTLASLPVVFSYCQYHFYRPNCWLNTNYRVFGDMLWPSLLFVLPVMLGGMAAKYVPKNAVIGVFAALCLDVVLGSVVSSFGGWLLPDAAFFRVFVGPATLLTTLWIPVACGAAALTGWRGRRARQIA